LREVSKTLVATFAGVLLAIVTQYYASHFQFSSQAQLQKIQGQRQVYSRLMGREFATRQLYVSRYEALIYSDYHEARWKVSHSPKDLIDLQESQRWMHRSEELVFEIVKNNQLLFEDLGMVRALFQGGTELDKLIDQIYNFHALTTSDPPPSGSVEALIKWKNESVRQLGNRSLNSLAFHQPTVWRAPGHPVSPLQYWQRPILQSVRFRSTGSRLPAHFQFADDFFIRRQSDLPQVLRRKVFGETQRQCDGGERGIDATRV